MKDLFFFKRKKLIEIETKLDRVLEMLENQGQKVEDGRNIDRQFLCEALDKKTEMLLNESKYSGEAIEATQRQCESKISDAVGQNTEEIKELCKILEKRDGTVKKTLKSLQQGIDKEQEMSGELAEKLELTENEIRMLLLNSVMDQLPQ